MKKTLKVLAIVGVVLICLFIAAIIGIYTFTNPNDYKDTIAGKVQETTGRAFAIQGNIGLSVFPFLELKVGGMTLGNPPEFGDTPMAQIEQANIGLKLLPLLLRKELEMKKILLKGLDIRLIRNQEGVSNWDDLAKRFASKEEKPDSDNKSDSESMLDKLDIAGVKLNNLRAAFEDKQQGVSYQVSDLNLDSGSLKIGKPWEIDLQFHLASAKPRISANVDLKTVIHLLLNEKQATLEHTKFALVLDAFQDQKSKDSLSGTLNLASDMAVNWESGDFKAENLNLKTDMKGSQLPNGAADAELKAALLSLNWKKGNLECTDFDLSDNKNNHTLKGTVSVADFTQPTIRFDLTGNEIDVTRYLSDSSDKKSATKEESDSLQNPDISGTLRLAKIKISEMSFSDVFLNIEPHSGKNKDSRDLNLRFQITSSQPEIQANLDLKTVMSLFLKNQQVTLENTKLTLGQGNLVLEKGDAAIKGDTDLLGNIFVNWGDGQFKIDNLNLTSDLKGGEIPGGGIALKLNGNTDLNWKKESLSVTNMDVKAYDMHITGNTNADRLFSTPQIKTTLNIAEFSPKKLMQMLKIDTKESKGLNKASGTLSLTANKERINLSNFKVRLDDTNLQGNVDIAMSKLREIRFDVKADTIDMNQYLTEKTSSDAPETGEKSGLPTKMLRSLVLDGKVVVGKLKVRNINLQDATVKITAKDGLFHIDPLSTMLYGGKYVSDIQADFRGETPRSALNINLSGLQLGNLLKGLIGEEKVTGAANLNLALSGIGADWNLLRKNLNGEGSFALKEGVFHGFQIIPDMVREQVLALDPKKRIEKISKQQEFKDINGRVNIRNSLIRSDNLTLTGDRLQVIAKGITDLAKGEIDYDIQANIEGIPMIPYKIKGPFSHITASLDPVEFAKSLVKGVVKIPLNVGTGVLDIGTGVLDKGKEVIGKGDGVKNIGKGVLDVGKGVLDMGKGILDVGKGTVDTEKKEVKEGAQDVGEGVKGVGKGVTDIGKGTIEAIGSGLKGILGGDKKEKENP